MLLKRCRIYPMNVVLASGSNAEQSWKTRRGIPLSRKANEAIPLISAPAVNGAAPVSGLPPTPSRDLIYHGGKILPDLAFVNLYLGGASKWKPSDITHIDGALAAAMTDAHLNNVMTQYFPSGHITSDFQGSRTLTNALPDTVDEDFLQEFIFDEFDRGTFANADLSKTVFNLLLPPGVVLKLKEGSDDFVPVADGEEGESAERAADSRHGLGGFHGSVPIPTGNGGVSTIYFATGVFSFRDAQGRQNGIVAFNEPWKNVVATFYHELNEARTDADVGDVIATHNLKFWGWADSQGGECGDFPMEEVGGDLGRVIQDVPLANGQGSVPIQFQYSNFAHGPEGPVSTPRPFSHRLAPGVVV